MTEWGLRWKQYDVWTSYLFFIQVFSAFGFVHKIATFEKTAGFQVSELLSIALPPMCSWLCKFWQCLMPWQALIQFTDAETASSARDALDGRSIPRQVVPFVLFPLFFNPIYNSSYSLIRPKFAESLVVWHVDTCFQPMLVLVTCEFHIPHIKIWISNFSQIAAGNDGSKDKYHILFFRFYHWFFLRNSNKLWKLLYFTFCGVL